MSAVEEKRLPESIGGLMELALRTYVERAPFFLLLAFGAAAAGAIAEWAIPAATLGSPQGEFKEYVLILTQLFVDAYIVAAVAIAMGLRTAGTNAGARELGGAAAERWLIVIAVMFLAAVMQISTAPLSGIDGIPDPPVLLVVAPFTWILWGVLGLTGPVAALTAERGALAVLNAFGRAFTLPLQRQNLVRLCVLAAITMIPNAIESIAQDQLVQHHVARALFWSNIPFDALTVGPLAAIQTVFALDFARRAGRLEQPPKR